MKGLTELQETKELWNLGDGLENVCNSVMRKLHHAGHVLEERNRTIINQQKEFAAVLHFILNIFPLSFSRVHLDKIRRTERTM